MKGGNSWRIDGLELSSLNCVVRVTASAKAERRMKEEMIAFDQYTESLELFCL